MMHRTLPAMAAMLLLALPLTACQNNDNAQAAALSEVSIRATVEAADPEAAAAAIYETLPEREVTLLDDDELLELVGIDPDSITDYLAYYSDASSGLSDMIFIIPKSNNRDQIREQLYAYQAVRAESFRNYDILNAYSIASGAIVYDQGDYLILLMLPDNEAAQELIDNYIPQ